MTQREVFMKKGICKNKHCSARSFSNWCELNSKCHFLKVHKLCFISKRRCQKQFTFTPKQFFQREGRSVKNELHKKFTGTQTA